MANVQNCKAGVTIKPVTMNLWYVNNDVNPLNAELNPICHLLALLGVHHFLHVSRIRVKSHMEMYHKYIYTLHIK